MTPLVNKLRMTGWDSFGPAVVAEVAGGRLRHSELVSESGLVYSKFVRTIYFPTVYIMGNSRPTLYIGVTSDPFQRIWAHKNDLVEGFTNKYGLHKLLYYESYETIDEAILREKQLKRWHREWKLNLIKSVNPDFKDLYEKLLKEESGGS